VERPGLLPGERTLAACWLHDPDRTVRRSADGPERRGRVHAERAARRRELAKDFDVSRRG
jgi:hypothetical protein